MNAGVEILLQRMKDNPEDFYYHPNKGMSRWHRLVDHAIADEVVTQEEKDALDAGMKEVRRQSFTETVMKELAGEGEPSDEEKSLRHPIQGTGLGGLTLGQSTGLTNGGFTLTNAGAVTGTLNAGSITLGDTTLSEAGLKQMLATHRAMREETKSKHWWNKSLHEVFGKK